MERKHLCGVAGWDKVVSVASRTLLGLGIAYVSPIAQVAGLVP